MSSEYTVSIKLHNKKFDKVMDVNKIYNRSKT